MFLQICCLCFFVFPWFYWVLTQKCWKPLVLQCCRSNMLKNRWFYKQRDRKTKPGDGRRIQGLEFAYSLHIYSDEPLQTSCLGNSYPRRPWDVLARMSTNYKGFPSDFLSCSTKYPAHNVYTNCPHCHQSGAAGHCAEMIASAFCFWCMRTLQVQIFGAHQMSKKTQGKTLDWAGFPRFMC